MAPRRPGRRPGGAVPSAGLPADPSVRLGIPFARAPSALVHPVGAADPARSGAVARLPGAGGGGPAGPGPRGGPVLEARARLAVGGALARQPALPDRPGPA